ncbi:hypothetical protein BJV82DRAFT_703854 [Fennellomyces sp. T-0311]|nr:hypothetical protein BJV82DRAFT_703854 [Fennellomyces sp. T-0311]
MGLFPFSTLAIAATLQLIFPVYGAPPVTNIGTFVTNLSDSFGTPHRLLGKRDYLTEVDNICPKNKQNHVAEVLNHFTAVIFGSFETFGSQDILGPLAVGGSISAPNYLINANHRLACTSPEEVPRFGFVVGGDVDTYDTKIRGSAYSLYKNSELKMLSTDEGCEMYNTTIPVDFPQVERASISASLNLASTEPNLKLHADGRVEVLEETNSMFKIFTFDSCSGCEVNGILSDPSAIFFNTGNWNGPQNWTPGPNDVVVFNIPVLTGTTITINTNNPSNGFNACRTVYNFFPVRETGTYTSLGEFTLIRQTASQFEGFTLAPQGHILDGTTGNFAGNLIARSYTWLSNSGVEIHDYASTGDGCDSFLGCLPMNGGAGSGNNDRITSTTTYYEVDTTTFTSEVVTPGIAPVTMVVKFLVYEGSILTYTLPPDFPTTTIPTVTTECETMTSEVTITQEPRTVTTSLTLTNTRIVTTPVTEVSTEVVTETYQTTDIVTITFITAGKEITNTITVTGDDGRPVTATITVTDPPETVITEVERTQTVTTTDTSLTTDVITMTHTELETVTNDVTVTQPPEVYTTTVETLIQVSKTETVEILVTTATGTVTEFTQVRSEPTTVTLVSTTLSDITQEISEAREVTRTRTSELTLTPTRTVLPFYTTTRTRTATVGPIVTERPSLVYAVPHISYSKVNHKHKKGKKKNGKWGHEKNLSDKHREYNKEDV